MNRNRKQCILILAILAITVVLSCVFAACDKTESQEVIYNVRIHQNNGQADILWDTATDIPTIKKDGYHIAGYYLDENFATSITLESLKNTVLTADVDVYVKWEKDECNHVEAIDAAVAPICTKSGLTEGKHCSVCGAVLQAQTEVAALGHDLQRHDKKDATCIEKGWKEYETCSRCEYTTYAETAVLGHDYSTEWTTDVQPTCTAKGSKSHHCSRCGDKADVTEVAIFGHTGGEATCTEKATCTRCNQKYGNALGHDMQHHDKKDATCTEKGWTEYETCSRCDYTTYVEIGALGHEYSTEWTMDIEPTCTTKGSKSHHCSRCGDKADVTEVSILGHEYSTEWTTDIEPTCTAKGSKSHHCRRCDDKIDVTEVAALGHFEIKHTAQAPTCANVGWNEYVTCSRCDYTTYSELSARHSFDANDVCTVCGYFETGLIFTLSTDGSYYEVSGIGTFNGEYLAIPSVNFDTKPVLSVSSGAFENVSTIKNVLIPASVKRIGESAFAGCTELTDIVIGSGVESIGDNAFGGCTKLNMVAWCATQCTSAGSLENPVFKDCDLEFLDINDGVATIPAYLFYNCNKIAYLTFPNSVESIGDGAFYGCTGIKNLSGEANILSIVAKQANPASFVVRILSGDVGESAFAKCGGLKDVAMENGVTSIGEGAFYECGALENAYIAGSVTSIGIRSFFRCTSLASVTMEDGIKTIGSSAFQECKALVSIVVPDGVERIGYGAFANCANLSTAEIPDSVTEIEAELFDGCRKLKDFAIGKDVKAIGAGAFRYCESIASITFPEGVTEIGEAAFYGCGLVEVNWNATECQTTGSKEYSIFNGCANLAKINVGQNVKSIPPAAFSKCSGLKTINYAGTTAQWSALEKGEDWNYNVPTDCKIVCSDGELSI